MKEDVSVGVFGLLVFVLLRPSEETLVKCASEKAEIIDLDILLSVLVSFLNLCFYLFTFTFCFQVLHFD